MRIQDIRSREDLKKYYLENGLVSIEKQIRELRNVMGIESMIFSGATNQAEILSCFEQQLLEIWDHRDMSLHRPVSEWTERDADHAREIIMTQGRELAGARDFNVTCGSCGEKSPLFRSFRCYHCGVWFCDFCAAQHFGGKRALSFDDAKNSPF